jgi:putative transposase
MASAEHLEKGYFYHLYNRGIDGCDIFKEPDNYEYFLNLYEKYIEPIADTYAWVLMKNHFHLLVQIKDLPGKSDLPGYKNPEGLRKPPHQYFSNLFNAYSKAFNKRFKRTGSLFEKNFHRKRINNNEYLRNVVVYIHQNPVHHKFCERASEYPWSSYKTCISLGYTKLKRDAVVGWFDDVGNFKYLHEQKMKTLEVEKWLKI